MDKIKAGPFENARAIKESLGPSSEKTKEAKEEEPKIDWGPDITPEKRAGLKARREKEIRRNIVHHMVEVNSFKPTSSFLDEMPEDSSIPEGPLVPNPETEEERMLARADEAVREDRDNLILRYKEAKRIYETFSRRMHNFRKEENARKGVGPSAYNDYLNAGVGYTPMPKLTERVKVAMGDMREIPKHRMEIETDFSKAVVKKVSELERKDEARKAFTAFDFTSVKGVGKKTATEIRNFCTTRGIETFPDLIEELEKAEEMTKRGYRGRGVKGVGKKTIVEIKSAIN